MVNLEKRHSDWENGLISDKEFIGEIEMALFHLTHKLAMEACEKRRADCVHAIVSLERSIVASLRKLGNFSNAE